VAAERRERFVCRRSEPIFAAVERCLDNGVGACFILDEDDLLLGSFSLGDARRAIVDGLLTRVATLSDYLEEAGRPDAASHGAAPNDVMSAVIRPRLDERGRLVDVVVDRSRQRVQVAQPDLSHRELRGALDAFLSTWISSQGERIRDFENRFAAYIGSGFGVAVSNGTTALHLALLALGIGPGDEVIVPDLTFAATVNAVLYCGATPVIVDIDPLRWTIAAAAVEEAVTPRTKAVIPVHLYGRPAEMTSLLAVARRHGLFVVEDCAEAHGARYAGRSVGRFGDIACFSFFANKIVTTGEGGMCLTDSQALAARMRILRDHGMTPDRAYWHERVGYNYRMTNLQAAIGLAQLERIDETLDRNRRLQVLYHEHLGSIAGVEFPAALPSDSRPVVWLCCALVPAAARDALITAARHEDIELRPFFHSISTMPPYQAYARDCPHSLALSRTGIALPTSRAIDVPVIEKLNRLFRQVLGDASAVGDCAHESGSSVAFALS